MLKIVEDHQLLNYCLPGSPLHTKHLKAIIGFKGSQQTKQLVQVLMYYQQFTASMAEKVLCYTLKSEASKLQRKDTVIRGYPLYFLQQAEPEVVV